MIKRILVGLSGTPFTPVAIQHAIDLAQIHGAELTGITVVDATRLLNVGPVPIGGGEYARRTGQRRLRLMEERIEKAIATFADDRKGRGATRSVRCGRFFVVRGGLRFLPRLPLFGHWQGSWPKMDWTTT